MQSRPGDVYQHNPQQHIAHPQAHLTNHPTSSHHAAHQQQQELRASQLPRHALQQGHSSYLPAAARYQSQSPAPVSLAGGVPSPSPTHFTSNTQVYPSSSSVSALSSSHHALREQQHHLRSSYSQSNQPQPRSHAQQPRQTHTHLQSHATSASGWGDGQGRTAPPPQYFLSRAELNEINLKRELLRHAERRVMTDHKGNENYRVILKHYRDASERLGKHPRTHTLEDRKHIKTALDHANRLLQTALQDGADRPLTVAVAEFHKRWKRASLAQRRESARQAKRILDLHNQKYSVKTETVQSLATSYNDNNNTNTINPISNTIVNPIPIANAPPNEFHPRSGVAPPQPTNMEPKHVVPVNTSAHNTPEQTMNLLRKAAESVQALGGTLSTHGAEADGSYALNFTIGAAGLTTFELRVQFPTYPQGTQYAIKPREGLPLIYKEPIAEMFSAYLSRSNLNIRDVAAYWVSLEERLRTAMKKPAQHQQQPHQQPHPTQPPPQPHPQHLPQQQQPPPPQLQQQQQRLQRDGARW